MRQNYREEMMAEAITASATHLADIIGDRLADAFTRAVTGGLISQPALVDGTLVYTPEQAANLMGVSRDTMYNHLLREPGFPATRIGAKFLISAQGLIVWINQMHIKEAD